MEIEMNNRMTDLPSTPAHRLAVNVKAVAPDQYRADCQSLAGCVAYGRTRAEAKRRMGQAVSEYLAGHDVFVLMDPVDLMEFHES
jgi:predicted RNase H-like HicB family nuclease